MRRRSGPTKGDQRERAILDATRNLLAETSINDLTINAITKAAGVTRTGFYFYFPTKQAVVAALLDGLWDDFGGTHEWLTSAGPDRAGLLEHHRLVAAVWAEHAPILACTTGMNLDYQPLVDWVDAAHDRFVEALTTKLEADRAAGLAPVGVDAAVLAAMVSDLRDARFRVMATLDASDREQAVKDLTEVVLRMLYGLLA